MPQGRAWALELEIARGACRIITGTAPQLGLRHGKQQGRDGFGAGRERTASAQKEMTHVCINDARLDREHRGIPED